MTSNDTPYYELNAIHAINSHSDKDVDNSNELFNRFEWFDWIIRVSPMWVFHDTKMKRRSTCCNVFGISHIIFIFLYVVIAEGYYVYDAVSTESTRLFTAIYVVGEIFMVVSRIISLIYFAKYFNYPWNSFGKDLKIITNHHGLKEVFDRKVFRITVMMILFLILYMILCSLHYFPECVKDSGIPQILAYTPLVCWVLGWIYCLIFSHAIATCCVMLILLKHELFLLKLNHIVSIENQDKISYIEITDQYKKTVFAFEKECKFWKWYFALKFAGLLCYVWEYSSQIIHNEDLNIYLSLHYFAGIPFWIAPFFVLVIVSSNLSRSYHNFKQQLLLTFGAHMNQSKDDKKGDLNTIQECNYLYHYICAHPMVFIVFGYEFNLNTAMKLCIVFILAKLISYSIYNI